PSYRIDKAEYLLSFGADYLETWLSPTNNAVGFSKIKDVGNGKTGKIVHVEPRSSMTAASADKWINIKPGTEQYLALGIANVIINKGWSKESSGVISDMVSNFTPKAVYELTEVKPELIEEIAREFSARNSLAIGGGAANTSSNATETLIAVNILNYLAGNIGKTVDFSDSLSISKARSYEDIKNLIEQMRSGDVELLIIHNVNPLFTLPSELKVQEAFDNTSYIVSFSSFIDESSENAHLILPESTSFESWGDFQPRKSVVSIIQPVMTQIFNTKTAGDILISSTKSVETIKDTFSETTYLEYLKDSWKKVGEYLEPNLSFEKFWEKVLVDGLVTISQPQQTVELSPELASIVFRPPVFSGEGDYYFITYPSYRFLDGKGANKPWLQELPDALTTSVWDSWAEIHPDTASKMGLKTGAFVKIESPKGTIETQVFVYDGIRPDTVAVPFGQGHKSYGRYAKERGVNPLDILHDSSDKLSGGFAWLSTKVKIINTGKDDILVRTQYSLNQDDREIAQAISLDQLNNYNEHRETPPDFYPERQYQKYRWAMSIDLNKCTGCGACVTACYAENNIPFVGKSGVSNRREMSWLRIERFFEKNKDGSLDTRFIPMLCQHCGNAPCEPVCPVYATYHNHEGLNGMVYNRCVGTRYCANNCIYKVRRFNWFQYKLPEPLNWQLNPDVTVRSKGIMEKCTFCIQRINYAKDIAKDDNRLVSEGELKTACEQVCPSDAIVFGNLLDETSRVAKLSNDKRGYKVLEDINAKPGITYLKKVKQEKV
ncbi:MAG: molybdopterin-dependent oxidoreductase, partial [Thermodesulfobacteriota bacterium]